MYFKFHIGGIVLSFIYYLSAVILSIVAFSIVYLFEEKFTSAKISVRKIVVLIIVGLFTVREFISGYVIQKTIGLNVNSPFGPQGSTEAFVALLLIWLVYAVELLTILYPFFEEHIPRVKPLASYVSVVVYIAALVKFNTICVAFDGVSDGFVLRSLIFALEIGAGLGLSAFELVRGLKYRQSEKAGVSFKNIFTSASIFIGMVLISIPCWAPQVLFGKGREGIIIDDLNPYHRLFLYGLPIFAIIVHFLLKNGSYEQKRFGLIFISVATMISYSYYLDFSNITDIPSLPLHLCNTAMYIIPLVLIFKMEKLYYFTIFINVLGAFLAMVMPNTGEIGWLSDGSIKFWLNHYLAMLMPLLLMSLGIFKRPKMKQFCYSLIAFFGYYVAVLFINAYYTNFDSGIDFFFINSDFIASKLGKWAEDLRDITTVIPWGDLKLVLYPVYQSLYFIVYIILSFAMWFIYEQAFEISDTYQIITERNRKIKVDRLALETHLAGRSMQEPMNPQNKGKLILRHFSKRYSTSDVYAVYDANLEIEGGQIFGFLGPNGAGKSTIIKSIVGIQTITSGEIEVSGYDVEKQAVGAKMQIGFVPDHYALYENLTGREYINYIADLYKVKKKDRDERIKNYVERFRLEAAIDNPMKTYSHGMKQKITIMSALVHNPKIWILDEPLTGLDPESIFQVKECMKEHAAKGNIVFFSSHIIDVVERICDKIAIIRKGQILTVKSVSEIEAMGIPLEKFYMDTIDGNTQKPVSAKVAPPQAASTIGATK